MDNKININIFGLLVNLIMLFSITTLFQSIFDWIAINKILGAIIILSTFKLYIMSIEKNQIVILYIFFISLLISLFQSNDLITDVTEWIYVIETYFILNLLYRPKNSKEISENIKTKCNIMFSTVNFSSLVILLFIIFKVGYVHVWGEGMYFRGLCNSEHTMASVLCLLLSFVFILSKIKDKYSWYYVLLTFILIYALLETGARVFLIPASILLILILKSCVTNKKVRFLSYFIGMMLFSYALISSSMLDKFFYAFNVVNRSNSLDTFTSGRSQFWLLDLKEYLNGDILKILFGNSFDYVMELNEINFGIRIGPHNDIIYLLHGTGVFVTIIWIYMCGKLLYKIKRNTNLSLCIALGIYMIAPMLLNGFFPYQHYVYSFLIVYITSTIKNKNDIQI